MQKQPYNLAIRFTLVIIINNECVSNYAYAAATVLNGILKTCIFHLHLRDAAKNNLKMIKGKQYNKWKSLAIYCRKQGHNQNVTFQNICFRNAYIYKTITSGLSHKLKSAGLPIT